MNLLGAGNSSKKNNHSDKAYRANREDSNFLLGCFQINKEDYDELKVSLKELITSFEKLKKIQFEDKTYKIEYFLGGDLKFLALALGISAAMSIHPCPFCTSKKEDFITEIHNHEANRNYKSKQN